MLALVFLPSPHECLQLSQGSLQTLKELLAPAGRWVQSPVLKRCQQPFRSWPLQRHREPSRCFRALSCLLGRPMGSTVNTVVL